MKDLENILQLVQDLELEMVEDGVIEDDGIYTDRFEVIKRLLYNKIRN